MHATEEAETRPAKPEPSSAVAVNLRELAALAVAGRELLRAGLAAEARPLLERLAAALEGAVAASTPRTVDLVAERARRRLG